MKGRILLTLLFFLPLQSFAFNWADLWFTKDQQGQRLMKQGKFKAAEETFREQDWRGAAAYRAGNYEQAAKYYNSLQNEQGFYNAGNALAKLGQYQQAVNAYDKALTLNPNNKDAQYNRNLIQQLLKKEQKKSGNDQQGQNQQGQNQQGQNQQGQNQQGQKQQGQNQQEQNQQGQNQQGQNQQGQNQQSQNQQSQNQQSQNQQSQNQQSQNQQSQNQPGQNQQESGEVGKNMQDQNDRETPAKQGINQTAEQKSGKTKGLTAESNEEREKKKAKEQWLQLIPDDPGGLMREKFLRDHMRRQRGWYQ